MQLRAIHNFPPTLLPPGLWSVVAIHFLIRGGISREAALVKVFSGTETCRKNSQDLKPIDRLFLDGFGFGMENPIIDTHFANYEKRI